MVNSMNDLHLAHLYRRLTGPAPHHEMLDVDALVAASEGKLAVAHRPVVAAALAISSADAALVRMLRELHGESAHLAAQVGSDAGQIAHPRRFGLMRHAPASRHSGNRRSARSRMGRWSAMAACLVAVLGLWSWQHTADVRDATMSRQAAQDRAMVDQLALSRNSIAARGDLIFTTRDDIFHAPMEPRGASAGTGDRLFHAGFNGS